MPFVIQGFALNFHSLTDMFFNGACFAMVELTVVMKDSRLFIHDHYLPQELHLSSTPVCVDHISF